MFSFGVRVPYIALVNAVLDFLRDVSEPYLRLFRRLPLRVGPLDLSPIVAILVLQIVGGIIVGLDRAVSAARAALARACAVAVARDRARPGHEGARARRDRARRAGRRDPRARPRQHAQHRRRVRLLRGGGAIVLVVAALALAALLVFFAPHLARPLVWLPTGLLLGGALGNLIDRVREGAVTDFIELPLWPAFNVADIGDHVRGARAALRAREPPREERSRSDG